MTRKAEASYDPRADAIGVYFAPSGVEYADSEEVAPGIVLDYDQDGRVIGVELLHIRQLIANAGAVADRNAAE